MADIRRTTIYVRDSSVCCGGFAGGCCDECERPEPRDGWRCSCGAQWTVDGSLWHCQGCDARETARG